MLDGGKYLAKEYTGKYAISESSAGKKWCLIIVKWVVYIFIILV